MNVCHKNHQHCVPAIIVPGSGPNVRGRDWLAMLKVNWASVYQEDKYIFLDDESCNVQRGNRHSKATEGKFYI